MGATGWGGRTGGVRWVGRDGWGGAGWGGAGGGCGRQGLRGGRGDRLQLPPDVSHACNHTHYLSSYHSELDVHSLLQH